MENKKPALPPPIINDAVLKFKDQLVVFIDEKGIYGM